MRETPAPRDPTPNGDPSGLPAGPGDHPWLGSPDWRLVPQSPDWDEVYLAAMADDEDSGDPTAPWVVIGSTTVTAVARSGSRRKTRLVWPSLSANISTIRLRHVGVVFPKMS